MFTEFPRDLKVSWSSHEDVKAEACRILNKIGALQFGAFKLTSGKISPYYVDLRLIPSFPDAFYRICDFYVNLIKEGVGEDNFNRVAGIPVAGMPFASVIAYNLKKPFIYVRKGVRLHGRQRRVEGILTSGDRVLLIDDLITTGLSLMRAAKAIIAEGGLVSDAAVLLDREEGGKEKLEGSGIKLHSLLNISEVANRFYEMGVINEERLKTILKQVKKGRKPYS